MGGRKSEIERLGQRQRELVSRQHLPAAGRGSTAAQGRRGERTRDRRLAASNLQAILPTVQRVAIERLLAALHQIVEKAPSYSRAEVLAGERNWARMSAEVRKLSSALGAVEKEIQGFSPPMLEAVFARVGSQRNLPKSTRGRPRGTRNHCEVFDPRRWMAELKAVRVTVEHLVRRKPKRRGHPEDVQGLFVALSVATALAAEGVPVVGPSRARTNPWSRFTKLVLSTVRGSPVQRVDRLLSNAAQWLGERGYSLSSLASRSPGRAQSERPDDYRRWAKLDRYLLSELGEEPAERNKAIAQRFGVTLDQVKRARKRGLLRR